VDYLNLKTFSLFVLAILISCERPEAVEKIKCVDRDPKTGMPIAAKRTFQSGLVNYRGVSFTFSPSIQAEVVAETRCAVPFDEQGKGAFNEYHPEHRAFVFKGNYSSQHTDSYFETPEIRIYPAAEYRALIGKSEDLETDLEREFEQLREALVKKPLSFANDAPFAAVVLGSQIFQAKVKYINFKKGKGILYLTYFCNDVFGGCAIDNQALSYIFQGLTDDGRYFIYGAFPIKTDILPLAGEESKGSDCFHSSVRLPPEEISAACRIYSQKVAGKLELLPPTSFEPPLTLFEGLFHSLNIAD
jgi:hypothetical protein